MHSLENPNNQSSSEGTNQQREEHIRTLHKKDNILKRLALKKQEEVHYLELSYRDKAIILLNSLHMKLITNNLTIESLLTEEEIKEALTISTKDKSTANNVLTHKIETQHIEYTKGQNNLKESTKSVNNLNKNEIAINEQKKETDKQKQESKIKESIKTEELKASNILFATTKISTSLIPKETLATSTPNESLTPIINAENLTNSITNTKRITEEIYKNNSSDEEYVSSNNPEKSISIQTTYKPHEINADQSSSIYNFSEEHLFYNRPYSDSQRANLETSTKMTILTEIESNTSHPTESQSKGDVAHRRKLYRDAVSSQKSGADQLVNRGQERHDESSSASLPQNIEKIPREPGLRVKATPRRTRANILAKASFHHERAISLKSVGQFANAIEAYNEAIDIEPKNTLYHYEKAITFSELDLHEEALASINQAIEIDPNNASYYHTKGEILEKPGWLDDAVEAYDCAMKREPNNILYYSRKAATLYKLTSYIKALTVINEGLKIKYNPSAHSNHFIDLHLYKAITLRTLGLHNDAAIALNEAIEQSTSPFPIYQVNKIYNRITSSPIAFFDDLIRYSDSKWHFVPFDSNTTPITQEISQIRETVENSAKDLATSIQKHKSYQGFPITEESILMLCGYDGKKKLSELDEEELLYLEGIAHGTIQILKRHNDQADENLTGEYLTAMQKEFLPKKEIKGSFGTITEMTGLRNQNTSFAIDTDGWIGYQEWKVQCNEWNNDSNHKLYQMFMTKEEINDGKVTNAVEYNNKAFAVIVNHKRKKQQLNRAIDYFFKECDSDIQAANSLFQKYDKDIQNDEKLAVIARTTHWLAKGQPFNDANSRVTVFCALRKLLLKNGLGPAIIEKEQTHIFKTRSTSVIYGTIRFGQEKFKYYKENSKEYLELIEKGEFNKELFEAKFNEQRKKREESFKNRVNLQKKSITPAYKSFKVYKKMEEVKKRINKITKEQLEGDMEDDYSFAKNIGGHIENFFIDRNYSDEASKESLFQINADISSLYNELQSIQSTDPLFQDLCILSQHIQKAKEETTTKNALASKYLSVPDNSGTASTKSNKSSTPSYKENEELVSVASEEEQTHNNISRRPSLLSDSGSATSQILDISALLPNPNTDTSKLNQD